MCGDKPCFESFFGLPLQLTVIIIGVLELLITIVATILNVVKYAKYLDPEGPECEGKDVCIGPLIKYSVFDAFFGVVCAMLLIVGAHTKSHCMLITWMIITFICSIKYILVVVFHDWTSLEVQFMFYTLLSNFLIIYAGLDLNHIPTLLFSCLHHHLVLLQGGQLMEVQHGNPIFPPLPLHPRTTYHPCGGESDLPSSNTWPPNVPKCNNTNSLSWSRPVSPLSSLL